MLNLLNMQNMFNWQNMQNMHNILSKRKITLNCVTKYRTGLFKFSKGVQHHGQLNSWPLIGLSTLALDPVLVPSFRRFTTHIDTIPISYNVACTVPHAMILFSCHDVVTFLVAIWDYYNCLCQVPAGQQEMSSIIQNMLLILSKYMPYLK